MEFSKFAISAKHKDVHCGRQPLVGSLKSSGEVRKIQERLQTNIAVTASMPNGAVTAISRGFFDFSAFGYIFSLLAEHSEVNY